MNKYFFYILLLVSINSFGQVNELDFYADAMVNMNLQEHRVFAQEKFAKILKDKIASNKYDLSFIDELKGISTQKLTKFNARMITWQNKGDDQSFNHFGMIVSDDGVIIELNDASRRLGESEYEILDAKDWYGAYYYDVMYDSIGNHYLLFGFNGVNGSQYEKIIDVLHKSSQGDWIFGKELFVIKEDKIRPDIKSRITVQYSPISVVVLKYDAATDMLIHDYTVGTTNDFDGNFIGKVPDGTYVGYTRNGELWKQIEKLENTPIEETRPDYNAKRDTNRPDILGRKKRGNK